jgi:hypothetical protein
MMNHTTVKGVIRQIGGDVVVLSGIGSQIIAVGVEEHGNMLILQTYTIFNFYLMAERTH